MTVERDMLAADGKSQMAVTVVVSPPAGVRLNGQTLFFAAEGGGQFIPPSVEIVNNRATSQYQAGFADNTQTVTLRASVDVFQVGRAQTERQITIQDEQVAVVFPPDCGYAVRYDADITGLTLPFFLQTDYPDLGGQYGLRFNVENGLLGATEADIHTIFFTLPASSGENEVHFQFPPDKPYGASPICVGVADKDNIPIQCTAVLWGSGATRWLRASRAEDFVGYFVPRTNSAPNTNVRLGVVGSIDGYTDFGLAYDVVWGGDALASRAVYNNANGEPITPNTCRIHRVTAGIVEPMTFYLDDAVQTPLIVAWRASGVGNDVPLLWHDETVIASYMAYPIQNTLTVELAEGATLAFLDRGYDAEFPLYVLSDDGAGAFLDVLVRIEAPLAQVDATTGMMIADDEGGVDVRSRDIWQGRNMRLILPNVNLPVAYISATVGESWQGLYVVGRVARDSVIRAVVQGDS